MTKPLIETVRWAVDGTDADAVNVLAPDAGQRDTGWEFEAVPASSIDNYWQNKAYRWFQYLDSGNFDGNITTTGSLTVGGQLLAFSNFTFTANSGTSQFTATAHGLQTGDGPIRLTSTGSLPSGLTTGTDYWVVGVDANNFQIATTLANALDLQIIAFLSNGTGTLTVQHQSGTARVSSETVTNALSVAAGLSASDLVIGGQAFTLASTTFTANSGTDVIDLGSHGLQTGDGPLVVSNSGGALPGGLAAATNYWAIYSNFTKIKLAASLSDALNNVAIDLTSAGTGTHSIVSGTGCAHSGNAIVHGKLTVAGPLVLTEPGSIWISAASFQGDNVALFSIGFGGVATWTFPNTGASGGVAYSLSLPVGRTLSSVKWWFDKNTQPNAMTFNVWRQLEDGSSITGTPLSTVSDTSTGSGRISRTLTPGYVIEAGYFIQLNVVQTFTGTGNSTSFYGIVLSLA